MRYYFRPKFYLPFCGWDYNIVELLGVSPSIVSRALLGKGRIGPALRERIRKVNFKWLQGCV